MEENNVRRERAFDLAQIESNLEKEEERLRLRWGRWKLTDLEQLREKMCQNKCNKNLRLGLDMVKLHTAFGSIGVPPLVDENDLKLFCRLDDEHNWCLRSCGFTVQFNIHDFICKHHYEEMAYLLPCYRHAVPTLRRECGAKKCGPYIPFDNTIIGFAHRCRLLICDIRCTTDVLIRRCAVGYGQQAVHFIANYTSQQVSFWMQNLTKELNLAIQNPITIPASCSRLFCSKLNPC
uniref:Uncharacterized protein n=1 Tax=Setaria digitata TaxID=48799 RepID=A0A915Q6Z0_9BILA